MSTVGNLSANVVHEAIDERQYVRTKIPAKVTLSGGGIPPTECQIEDISLGGLGLNCEQPLKIGSLLYASIHLRLNAVVLNIDARIKVVSQRGPLVGTEFIELDEQKRDILRYLISAYMSGEIADINGLLHVLQRENYIKQRKHKASTSRSLWERLRAAFGSLLFLAAGLLVASLLLHKLYLLFFHVAASQALVSANAYVVSMPENGYVKLLVDPRQPRVAVGQPIASVSTQLATSINTPSDLEALARLAPADAEALLNRSLVETVIASPCDCEVYFPTKRPDGYAYKYDELAHLLPVDEGLFVQASFPFDRLKDVNRVSRVELSLFGGGEPIAGTVVDSALDSENQALVLTIQPAEPLPREAYRKPLAVDVYLGLPFSGLLAELRRE
ncbi:PilZ domain-containing protein [Zestomonas carbonaria]|uniref:Mannuronan synthase n=1 Tax=Zestomonas carbonaria TaxID=2762745 RepID=A0A7U7ELN8_9GAMM|nr:PilZ domain-containing protein [Pseudomonas carbonaria]CAD5107309.1 Mannuronan synthase [Pseudomonas carbonaria]